MTSKQRLGLKTLAVRALADVTGVTAIEYALLLPVLLVFLLGIIDSGRAVWTQATLDHAAEAAARCGAVDAAKCGTPDAIKAYAVDRAGGLVLEPAVFSVAATTCGNQVSATLPFALILPWAGSNSITLKAKACYPL